MAGALGAGSIWQQAVGTSWPLLQALISLLQALIPLLQALISLLQALPPSCRC